MNSMSQKALAASLLLLSSLAAGHAYAQKVDDPTQYEYEQLQKEIVIGKTTKEEIRAKYGNRIRSIVRRPEKADTNRAGAIHPPIPTERK